MITGSGTLMPGMPRTNVNNVVIIEMRPRARG